MQTITSYHRPTSLGAALDLLAPNSVIVAGGTHPIAIAAAESAVIDLQDAGLHDITTDPDRVTYGAMTRVQEIVDHPATPPLLRDLAKREGPNTLRNAATVGGTVAIADPASELLAGLLVYDAMVSVATRDGVTTSPLQDVLATRGAGIITAVTVATSGTTAVARTGRTPADTSIVAAVGRATAAGTRLALTGVAATPVLVAPDEVTALNPPGDFRGSPEYRQALATTLTRRVLAELGGVA